MRKTAALLVAALVALGACSDDDDEAGDTTTATQANDTAATTTATTTTVRPVTTTTGRPTTTETTEDDDATTDSTGTTDDSDEAGTTDADETGTTDTDDSTDVTSIEDRLDVIEQALADGDFGIMLEALNLSGLADELEERAVTILAPSDDAFGELALADYTKLVQNPDEFRNLVNRHIIDEALTYDELAARTEVTTMSGETLQVTFQDGVLEVEGGVVTEREGDRLDGEGGQELVVLAIDKVLLEVG